MALPGYDDAYERAADAPAFSNGFECERCTNDEDEGCPLVLVAMMERTPAEWNLKDRSDLGGQYECTEFAAAS